MSRRMVTLAGLLLVLLQLTPCRSQNDDPCLVYTLMDMHDGRRESTYVPHDTEPLHCDDDIDSDVWVRFQSSDGASYQMTNQDCVEQNHCGTTWPMWMDRWSSHPTVVGTEETATVCLNNGGTSCCTTPFFDDIIVRLCEDQAGDRFFVYKLPNPGGCHAAYCVDEVLEECQPNHHRDPNTNLCVLSYPQQNPPTLVGPTNEGSFSCHVSYLGDPAKEGDARFDVRFLFDGNPAFLDPVSTVAAGEGATLEEMRLKGYLGKQLSCSSTPHWVYLTDGTQGPVVESANSYFVGIQVETNRIEISEADDVPKEVALWSTLPIVCRGEPCSVCTRLVIEEMTLTECEYCFTPADWRPSEKRAYGDPLLVSAEKNQRLDGPTVYALDFGPFGYKYDQAGGTGIDRTWRDYGIDDISVVFEDANHGLCSVWGDPRMRTFDGHSYSLYEIGQFLMFQSTAARAFEVHARFWACQPWDRFSCVCGVAVREGDAVLGVDTCDSRPSILRPKVVKYSPGSPPLGAYVSTDAGTTYYINMPSGAYVRVVIRPFGMNLYIHSLAEDQSKSSGLCGNFDGDHRNDVPSPQNVFVESHRLPQFGSFFDFNPWPNMPPSGLDIPKCRCDDEQVVDCSPEGGDGRLRVDPLEHNNQGGGSRRRKRDVDPLSDNVDDGEEREFDYGLNSTRNVDFTWPTLSGITESGARSICQATLDALPYKDDCLTLTAIDVEPIILQCMEDIKVMDDPVWAEESVVSFEESCRFLILENSTLYTKGDDGQLVPPTQIIGKMCPSQCNNRGACVDGVCHCEQGYVGTSCALVEDSPPVLHYIPGTGRCDLTLRPCREFRLVASDFLSTDDLTCLVTELASKAAAGDTPVSQSQTVLSTSQGTAKFVTSSEIACRLPEIASQDTAYSQLRFAFTYDGVTYSNEIDLTVFDGECLSCESNCDNPDSWVMLSDTCIIDGRCVNHGDFNEHSACFVCDPDRSIDSWTKVEAEVCKDATLPTQSPQDDSDGGDNKMLTGVLVGIGVTVLVILTSVAVVIVYFKFVHPSPRTAPHYEVPDKPNPHGNGGLGKLSTSKLEINLDNHHEDLPPVYSVDKDHMYVVPDRVVPLHPSVSNLPPYKPVA